MNFTFEKSNDVGVLTFDGKLTSKRAADLKAALMISLNNSCHLILNMERVTELDNTCLKLLRAAVSISNKLNKRITLVSLSRDLFRQASGAGQAQEEEKEDYLQYGFIPSPVMQAAFCSQKTVLGV